MPAYEVTLKLIKIWSEDKIQEELDGCKKNKQICDKIAVRMTKAESVEGMSTWTFLTIFHCSQLPESVNSTCSACKEARRNDVVARGTGTTAAHP